MLKLGSRREVLEADSLELALSLSAAVVVWRRHWIWLAAAIAQIKGGGLLQSFEESFLRL